MSFKSVCILFISFLLGSMLNAQMYSDYIGAGHEVGVTVTSSNLNGGDVSQNLVSGNSLPIDLKGASRFLAQATFGANYESIEGLSQIGIKSWLDSQFNMQASSYHDKYVDVLADANTIINNTEPRRDFVPFTFYEMIMEEPDVLRHKAAFALSQIFVISASGGVLFKRGFGVSSYYDILYQNAFGNFRDILMNVSLHPAMGAYLSHIDNSKKDLVRGRTPDENYAREIMQLFSIGLHELNNDGTLKLDTNGDVIPTYNIVDIQELSKVFTGLSGGAVSSGLLFFNGGLGRYDFTTPMIMYEDFHDKGEKVMIDGSILPANKPGMEDVNDAIDILFHHPNVGPFISIRLIQQLVKSNPTPAYVNRVATVFNNNGQGVRGDMKAVINAILIDPEARDCIWIEDAKSGKLLQPIERMTILFRGFDLETPSGRKFFPDFKYLNPTIEQAFLSSPTVFNFFSPFFAEQDYVSPNQMVSPEFQILNTTSGIYYLNLLEFSIKEQPFYNYSRSSSNSRFMINNPNDKPFLDIQDEINLYNNAGLSALLDRLDLILSRGQLSHSTKLIISNTISQNIANVSNYSSRNVVEDAMYYIMMSPNYVILK